MIKTAQKFVPIFLFLSSKLVTAQIQYVPAQILIPLVNHNNNNNSYGWNGSYLTQNNNNNWASYDHTIFNNSSPKFWTENGPTSNVPGHLFIGKIGPFDRLLFNQLYFKDSRWWSFREKTIEYPTDLGTSGYVRHETITAIHVINKFYQGNHANASVVAGGIGRQYVKMKLSSNWGYGFKFLVQIYGR